MKENGNGEEWKDEMDSGVHEMRVGLICRSKGGEYVGGNIRVDSGTLSH